MDVQGIGYNSITILQTRQKCKGRRQALIWGTLFAMSARTQTIWAVLIAVLLVGGVIVIPLFLRGAQVRRDQVFTGAAADGNMALLETRLAQGQDVNTTSFDNNGALFGAAFNRRVSAVHLLLAHSANPNSRSQFRQTALEAAVDNLSNDGGGAEAKADVAIIKMLLDKGADRAKIKQNAASVALLKRHGIGI